MTRCSHPSSARSEEKVSLGHPIQSGTPANNVSAEYGRPVGHDSSHVEQAIGIRPPRALRKDVSHLREKVIMARLELRERRVDMRQQHSLVRSLETQLLRHWQKLEGSTDQDAVAQLHGELCAALDKLGPIEEEYDEREDGLDTLEYDLESKEARYYRYMTQTDPDESDGSPSTNPSSTSSLSDEPDQDFLSPEYLYYSRVGDAKIVRERLMDLEAQKDQYLDIKREREALGIPLYQENIDFLSQYDSTYAEQQKELEEIEKDLYSLGRQAGFEYADEHQDELEEIERDLYSLGRQAGFEYADDPIETVTFHDMDWQSDPSTGQRQRSPLTQQGRRRQKGSTTEEYLLRKSKNEMWQRQSGPLTEPGQKRRTGSTVEECLRRKSENDVWELSSDPQSSRDRINEWILDRLKNSPIERAQHKAILNDPNLDVATWWSLVCQFWQHDRAARSSMTSSRNPSGLSVSMKAQDMHESLNLDLKASSSPFEMATQIPSGAKEAVLATDYLKGDISQLDYLDLAAGPLAKTRNGKWDSILGC
ncbi:MAG: hypothetical protein Q9223_005348 [Gallowayella weberi]